MVHDPKETKRRQLKIPTTVFILINKLIMAYLNQQFLDIKMLSRIILAFLLINLSLQQFGISTIAGRLYSTTTFQCIKNSGRTIADLVLQSKSNGYNQTLAQNLNNIRSAGMRAQLWVNPCRAHDPILEAHEILSKFDRTLYDRIWIAPSGNLDKACTWINSQLSALQNCKYLKAIVQQIRFSYMNVGISTNAQLWQTIFKGKCQQFGTQNLYWTPKNPNGKPSFSDFQPFGGWSKAIVKQYEVAATVCGTDVDLRFS